MSAPNHLVDSEKHAEWFEDTAAQWIASEKNVTTIGDLASHSDETDVGRSEADALSKSHAKDNDTASTASQTASRRKARQRRRILEEDRFELPDFDDFAGPTLSIPAELKELEEPSQPKFRLRKPPKWGATLSRIIENPMEYYKGVRAARS